MWDPTFIQDLSTFSAALAALYTVKSPHPRRQTMYHVRVQTHQEE